MLLHHTPIPSNKKPNAFQLDYNTFPAHINFTHRQIKFYPTNGKGGKTQLRLGEAIQRK